MWLLKFCKHAIKIGFKQRLYLVYKCIWIGFSDISISWSLKPLPFARCFSKELIVVLRTLWNLDQNWFQAIRYKIVLSVSSKVIEIRWNHKFCRAASNTNCSRLGDTFWLTSIDKYTAHPKINIRAP